MHEYPNIRRQRERRTDSPSRALPHRGPRSGNGKATVVTVVDPSLRSRIDGATDGVFNKVHVDSGLHLTVGLLISLAGLWLFAGVTEDVVHGDPLTKFDVAVLHVFRTHSTALGDSIFYAISLIGSPLVMAIIGAAVAALLAFRRQWIMLGGWLAAYVGGELLDIALKHVIQRPRPLGALQFLHGLSFSFPSGHAMGSVFGYGMLAYVMLVTFPGARRRAGVVGAAVMLVLAIGLSRLYLGVHYFSDVVGGYAAGVIWLSACISGVEIARQRRASLAAEPEDPET